VSLVRSGKCGLCGEESAEFMFSGSDRLLDIPGTYDVVRCVGCGLARTEPQLPAEEQAKYFTPEEGEVPGKSVRMQLYQSRLAAKVDKAFSGNATRRVLDIGCSDGLFLISMRSRGWETMGVEIGEESSRIAREVNGLNVVTGNLFSQEIESGSFDAVTMTHVLEHLPDPVGALERVRDLLKPGGMLLISVPNHRGPDSRLFGASWYGWAIPPHLYHFDKKSVSKVIEKAGLKPGRTTYLPMFFLPQNVRQMLKRNTPKQPGGSGAAGKKTSGRADGLKTVIFKTILTVSDLTGRVLPGEIMEIEAWK
jgi:SAM-dependent methyltransferase